MRLRRVNAPGVTEFIAPDLRGYYKSLGESGTMKDLREQIYFTDNEIARNKKRIENSTATEKNKELILRFADFCAAAGASKCRISILLWHLELFARFLDKDFDQATREDMEKAVAKFNQTEYSDSTKATVKKNVKQFYRWLYKRDKGDPLPDCVKWIESPDPPTNIKKTCSRGRR